MDIATLGIAVDSSQVTKATDALNKMAPSASAAETAARRLSDQMDSFVATPVGKIAIMEEAIRKTGGATHLTAGQMQNMAFQMNDMATMLASGQSPFVLLMQQGMQMAQIFGPGTGVTAALRMSGAALLAFATNPLTLTVLGMSAAAGAASALWAAVSDVEDTEALLKRHVALVDQIDDAWNDARNGAAGYVEKMTDVMRADLLSQTIKETGALRDALRALAPAAGDSTSTILRSMGIFGQAIDGARTTISGISEELANVNVPQGFIDEWRAFQQDAADGYADVLAFRERISSLAVKFPTKDAIAFRDRVMEITAAAAEMAKKLDESGAAASKFMMADRFFDAFGGAEPSSLQDAIKKRDRTLADYDRQQKAIDGVLERLAFQEAQLGRTAREQAIYNALQQAGVTITSQYGQRIAEAAGRLYDMQVVQDATTKAMENARDMVRGFAGDFVHGMLDGTSAVESLTSAVGRLGDKLIDMALDRSINSLFANLLQGGVSVSAIGAGLYAKGGVFGPAGEITAFARGGIVDRPTVFPFAKGVGLMGEAGPEAIMPLARGPGGRLGVSAKGGESATPIINNISIDARGAAPGVGAEIERAIQRAISDYDRRQLPRRVMKLKHDTIVVNG